MKICYLILAHNNPSHFDRLINAISYDRNSVYVHIDLKSSISEFLPAAAENVVFIKERVSVYWGGYSIVWATLNLLNVALEANCGHDYYCLLSGNDYPIRSKDYINCYLEKNYGQEFINLVEMPNELVSKPLSRITTYHIEDGELSKFFLPNFMVNKITKIVNKLRLQRDYNKILQGMKPYAGSQWWILSRPAVEYIKNFVLSRKDFVMFYKNTQIPDESFFQTIIGNSPFKSSAARNVTFTDWSRRKGPKPAIIDDDYIRFFEVGNLVVDDVYGKGEVLFARKFPNDSAELIDAIQKNLW